MLVQRMLQVLGYVHVYRVSLYRAGPFCLPKVLQFSIPISSSYDEYKFEELLVENIVSIRLIRYFINICLILENLLLLTPY